MTTIAPNVREAVRLYGVYTADRFDTWTLYGRAKASCRAHIMGALLGHKVPQAKAGMNALRDALFSAIGCTGDCLAAHEDDFVVRARGVLHSPETSAQ